MIEHYAKKLVTDGARPNRLGVGGYIVSSFWFERLVEALDIEKKTEEARQNHALIRQLAREEAEKVHAEKVAAQNFGGTTTVTGEGESVSPWSYTVIGKTSKKRGGKKR